MHELVMVSPDVVYISRLPSLQQLPDAVYVVGLCIRIHLESLLEPPDVHDVAHKVGFFAVMFLQEVLEFGSLALVRCKVEV